MTTLLDVGDVQRLLPHRFPFLLIDRVLEVEPGKRLLARKNVTINEPFFNGHFPGFPVMPGVLLVEAIAQAGGLLALHSRPMAEDEYMMFAGIDNARFRQAVVPGDQLDIEVTVLRLRSRAAHMQGIVTVDGKTVVEAEILSLVGKRPASDRAEAWLEGSAR